LDATKIVGLCKREELTKIPQCILANSRDVEHRLNEDVIQKLHKRQFTTN
jgi:hypothetical protein